jgi:hypothetical protein
MAIDAPPRPPAQDDPDALIPEARERQLRRRRLAAATIAVATAIGLGIYALVSGGSHPAPGSSTAGRLATCPLRGLALSVRTQGTAMQSVTFLNVRNPEHLTCSISAPVIFEVTQNGQRARVAGNPLHARLHATLRGAKSVYSVVPNDVWWGNWCGSRKGLRMTARIGSRTVASRFNYLPYCNAPSRQSKLSPPTS